MKRVLITGANSYVGTNVEAWLMREPDKYYVETLDMKDPNWKDFDFSKFDVVFHVAGIAHEKRKSSEEIYYKINCQLAIETFELSQKSNVKQFIFMSSMSVYSDKFTVIDETTVTSPSTIYGNSKLKAEKLLNSKSRNGTTVSIVRPPIIYGYNSPGNYKRLSLLAKKTIIFPKINNRRSMIHIYNLCEFIRVVIDNEITGILFPQNHYYACTSELVKTISSLHHKKVIFTKFFNPLIYLIKLKSFNKLFGNMYYEKKLSDIAFNYNVIDYKQSIIQSEFGDD